jgi:hypothetical protein
LGKIKQFGGKFEIYYSSRKNEKEWILREIGYLTLGGRRKMLNTKWWRGDVVGDECGSGFF